MEHFIFSLNATMPVFLMMALGWLFRRLNVLSDDLAAGMNRFVFRITLPVLMFSELAPLDLSEAWDTKFVLFCMAVTLVSIAAAFALSFLLKDRSVRGEFIQAAYRSSASILGVAFIQNIYGNAGMAPMMIVGSVPLYNIMAVVVLSLFRPERSTDDRALPGKIALGIITNPILLGIVAGLIWSALRLPFPVILDKTVSGLGGLSTPLGLMAMGAAFDHKKLSGMLKPSAIAAGVKLAGFCVLFLPLAVLVGFRNEELVAILVMLGSATTVSSYVMARNMGHDGTLTSTVVMLTTLFSAFTMTFWIWLLRSLGLI